MDNGIAGRERPTICFVAPNLGPMLFPASATAFAGGAEFRQQILARELARRGFHVCVVTTDRGERLGEGPDGIRIIYARSAERGWPVIRFVHPRLTSWWRSLREANADVYFQSTAGFLTLLVACFCRVHRRRFVYSAASDLDFRPNDIKRLFQRRAGWRDRWMYQLGVRLTDAIVAQHAGQLSDCRKWYRREAVLIPNCYELSHHKAPKADGVILWVSTIKRGKRPELFLDLARELPHLRFRMIGGPSEGSDAPLFDKIRVEASKLHNLEYVGFVPTHEIEHHFDDARLFVNTSDFEGFPNTFLQSWNRRIPTVSFINCHCREGSEPVGITCTDLAHMTRVVAELASNDHLWREMGIRAQRHSINHHSVGAAVNAYTALFTRLTKPA
jgi:glycosyltransferase involved in cell wall biosynthesis